MTTMNDNNCSKLHGGNNRREGMVATVDLSNMNTNFMHQIFQMNNKAVELLQEQNPTNAVVLLRRALEMAQGELTRRRISVYSNDGTPTPTSTMIMDDNDDKNFDVEIATIGIQNAHYENEGGLNIICLFDRAFRLVPCSVQQQRQQDNSFIFSEQQVDHLLSILLYNIGIGQCLIASLTKTSSPLGIAMSIYEMSLRIVTNKTIGTLRRSHNLLLLALLNNIGHLNAYYVRIQQVKHCLAFMRDVLACFNTSIVLTEDETTFFCEQSFCQQNPADLIVAAPMA